jgi:hypothetical protein
MKRETSITPHFRLPKEIVRPEDALLLWCVRKCPEEQRSEQIRRLIHEGIDWPYLIESSSRHGLFPLLYKHFDSNHIEEVPKDILDRLHTRFLKNLLWNLGRTRELLKLLDLFDAEGVRAIPYKGSILAQLAYGDIALRQFDDLDIFIPLEHLKAAKDLLLSQGYNMDFIPTDRQEESYLKYKEQYSFYNDKNKILVEIHWQIVSRYYSISIDVDELLKHLQPISLSGREVMTFSPEDLLLILCIHGSKHLWERLGWVCDIANLIEACKPMDWERVREQTCQMRIERFVQLGLWLSKDLAGLELPEEIIRKIGRNYEIKKLTAKVYKRLFKGGQNSDELLEEHLFHLRLKEHLTDKARYCLELGVIPNLGDWQAVSLPDSPFPLYYFIRPFRLALQYCPSLLKRVFKACLA